MEQNETKVDVFLSETFFFIFSSYFIEFQLFPTHMAHKYRL